MKKLLIKKENIIYIVMFFLLFFVHFPLLTKNILTADVLLNNSYYNGYSWELSLGRFGLYIIGILKGFVSIPLIEYTISFILISIITLILLKLFDIKDKLSKIIFMFIMILSPIISSTILFHYCSVPYLLAFLFSVLAVYVYYNYKNKYIKYLIPIILIVISLSFYQAYLSVIVSTFFLYQIKLLFDKKIYYKESILYLLIILLGIVIYFICMKLSLIVFHIDMANYSNANNIGLSTILSIPNKFIDSYKLFYEMYFTNSFTKNTYLHNNIIYLLIFIMFIITYIINLIKSKINIKNKIISTILLLLIPVFLNSVIFVINDTKLQLLMSASYLVLFVFILRFEYKKHLKIIMVILFIVLLRNYLIQDQATYTTLNNTYNTYNTIIKSSINNHINELDKSFIVIGNIKNTDEISKLNYGYISDEGLFWDEYNLRVLGFERFCKQNYGLDIKFGNEELFNEVNNLNNKDITYIYRDNIIINLNNYNKKES